MTFKNWSCPIPARRANRPSRTPARRASKASRSTGTRRRPSSSGLRLAAGYAHHNALFVQFTFLTPDGDLRVVDGKRVEMVPRDFWNVPAPTGRGRGPAPWSPCATRTTAADSPEHLLHAELLRHGRRSPWDFPCFRVAVIGRNLTTAATTSPTARSATASTTSRRRGVSTGRSPSSSDGGYLTGRRSSTPLARKENSFWSPFTASGFPPGVSAA